VGETWFPPRRIKETFVPPRDYRYPFMSQSSLGPEPDTGRWL
jgi:hypothetical protein